jgi:hypothetical protein
VTENVRCCGCVCVVAFSSHLGSIAHTHPPTHPSTQHTCMYTPPVTGQALQDQGGQGQEGGAVLTTPSSEWRGRKTRRCLPRVFLSCFCLHRKKGKPRGVFRVCVLWFVSVLGAHGAIRGRACECVLNQEGETDKQTSAAEQEKKNKESKKINIKVVQKTLLSRDPKSDQS